MYTVSFQEMYVSMHVKIFYRSIKCHVPKMDTYVYVRIDVTSSKRESIFQSISALMDFIAHLFKEMYPNKSVLPKLFTQVGFLLLRDAFIYYAKTVCY